MFLKQLLIYKNHTLVREPIIFHKGLNLIVDEDTNEAKESGNNIGKTTVLKLIDFCLGGDGHNIYTDPETKNTNQVVKDFLYDDSTLIRLELVDNLDSQSKSVIIERNFVQGIKQIKKINGKNISSIKNFIIELSIVLFNNKLEKPSLRQILSKFIRYGVNEINNVLHVLHSGKLSEYEALYFFLLGIPIKDSAKKLALERSLDIEKKLKNRLQGNDSESKLNQTIRLLEKEIIKLEEQKDKIEFQPQYKEDLQALDGVKKDINSACSEISRLKLRLSLIEKSKQSIENQYADINIDELRSIYSDAKKFIPTLHKSFESVLTFHNEMIGSKISFLLKSVPEINENISNLMSSLQSLTQQEKNLSKKLMNSGIFASYDDITVDLYELYREKGVTQERLERLVSVINEISRIETELDTIKNSILGLAQQIEQKLSVFNNYFSSYSYDVYGERYLLSLKDKNEKDKAFGFQISSIENNVGTGKKKSLIAIFDLSYLAFSITEKIDFLHFVLHDQLETIHSNQLLALMNIANNINGQYIVPILKDRIPIELKNADDYIVLKLSQKRKLFNL